MVQKHYIITAGVGNPNLTVKERIMAPFLLPVLDTLQKCSAKHACSVSTFSRRFFINSFLCTARCMQSFYADTSATSGLWLLSVALYQRKSKAWETKDPPRDEGCTCCCLGGSLFSTLMFYS